MLDISQQYDIKLFKLKLKFNQSRDTQSLDFEHYNYTIQTENENIISNKCKYGKTFPAFIKGFLLTLLQIYSNCNIILFFK